MPPALHWQLCVYFKYINLTTRSDRKWWVLLFIHSVLQRFCYSSTLCFRVFLHMKGSLMVANPVLSWHFSGCYFKQSFHLYLESPDLFPFYWIIPKKNENIPKSQPQIKISLDPCYLISLLFFTAKFLKRVVYNFRN